MSVGSSALPKPRSFAFYLGTFLFWASLYVYVPILSVYARSAGASLALVGWVVGSYGLAQLVLRIPLGVISDRWGRRKPFLLAGALAAGVGCLGLAIFPDPHAMILFRAITGVGASTWVAFTTLFASYFPSERTTWALGSLTFCATSALVIASPAGGWLGEELGWKAPFLAGAGLAAIALAALLPSPEMPTRRSYLPTIKELGRVATSPFLVAISAVALMEQFLTFTTVFSFTPLYAASLGASKADLGMLLTITLIPRALSTLVAAWLASRAGEKATVSLGLTLAGLSAMATPQMPSLLPLAACQALLGAGLGLSYPTLMGLCIRQVSPAQRATAMGVFQAIYALGMSLGPILSGAVAESAGMASAFYLAGISGLLSAAAMRFLLRLPRERTIAVG